MVSLRHDFFGKTKKMKFWAHRKDMMFLCTLKRSSDRGHRVFTLLGIFMSYFSIYTMP